MSRNKDATGKRSAARADNEAALLAAAEIEFAEHGFAGATTAAIAARAGIPKANLHYYFPTKEALYRTVLSTVLEAWLAAAQSFDGDQPARIALAHYIGAKMDLARRYPVSSRLFASEIMRGAPVMQDFLDTTLRAWIAGREPIIAGWVASGQLRPIAPRTLIYLIWAATQHYADFAHQIATLNGGTDLTDADFEAAKTQVIDLVLGGAAAPEQQAISRGGDTQSAQRNTAGQHSQGGVFRNEA